MSSARLPRGRVVNTAVEATRTERAWTALDTVPDPEVPAISVRDLGIVREVLDHGTSMEIVLTPTYSGCPATEVIER
ncbi:MAG: metal-sulfur cluster assembly factor, partial [Rubrivivax sp.]